MNKKTYKYPVVDLFAGPGGLGEGFATMTNDDNQRRFNTVASIDDNEYACQTLLLRHFVRNFPHDKVPREYYEYLGGNIPFEDLNKRYRSEFKKAEKSVKCIKLCEKNRSQVKSVIGRKVAGHSKWVLVGGPPCQAYSIAGRSRMKNQIDFEKDSRHFLYQEYLNTILDHKPPVFVLENVKGMISSKFGQESVINKIMSDLKSPFVNSKEPSNGLTYRLASLTESYISDDEEVDPNRFVVKMEEYGVPQARHRIFIIGIRSDLNCIAPRTLEKENNSPVVEDIIGDLPAIRSGITQGPDSVSRWRKEVSLLADGRRLRHLTANSNSAGIRSRVQEIVHDNEFPENRGDKSYPNCYRKSPVDDLGIVDDHQLRVLNGHQSRSHMPSDLRRYMFATVFSEMVGKSPKLADYPGFLLPSHANVTQGKAGTMFSDRFRVQLRNQVSTTITSHISKDGHYYIHYDPFQCRTLTVREAARLQTFPDNYKFEGTRTAQYQQIGNAVPPFIARKIAAIVAEILDSIKD